MTRKNVKKYGNYFVRCVGEDSSGPILQLMKQDESNEYRLLGYTYSYDRAEKAIREWQQQYKTHKQSTGGM